MSGSKPPSKAGNNSSSIPPADRKLVSSLKEVVPHSEEEIYAMLKECNRDPDETVQRLLNEEKFHVVKSKRDKKKETVTTKDSIAGNSVRTSGRNVGSYAYRGSARGSSSMRTSTNEPNTGRSKMTSAKEMTIPSVIKNPVSTTFPAGKMSYSELVQPKDQKFNNISATTNGEMPLSRPSSTLAEAWPPGPPSVTPAVLQGAWRAGTTHGTIADLLKSGNPSQKPRGAVGGAPPNSTNTTAALPAAMSTQQISPGDMCLSPSDPVLNPPLNSRTQNHGSIVDRSSMVVSEKSSSYFSETINKAASPSIGKNLDGLKLPTEPNSSAGVLQEERLPNAGESTEECSQSNENEEHLTSCSGDQYNSVSTDSSGTNWGHDAVVTVESTPVNPDVDRISSSMNSPSTEDLLTATVKLQGLNVHEKHQVIIPDHILVPEADRSMLNFGSFGSGFDDISSEFKNGEDAEIPISDDVPEEVPAVAESISRNDVETSSPLLEQEHSEDQVSTQDSGAIQEHREAAEVGQTAHDSYPQNLVSIDSIPQQTDNSSHYAVDVADSRPADINKPLQSYDNSTYYSGMFPSVSEVDTRYPPFLQPNPATKIASTSRPGTAGQSPSSQELPSSVGYSSSNVVGTQTLPSASSLPTSITLSQQTLPIPAYSAQPSALPMGPFANVFSYPYMPPGFSYLQSPYQPNLLGTGNYHHLPSPAIGAPGMKYPLPQMKTTGTLVSGIHNTINPNTLSYGGYPTSQPGSFPVNPPVTGGNSSSFDDNSSQSYKDSNVYIPNQQMEGHSMWLQNQLARDVQGSSYYNISSQNQQSRYSQPQTQSLAHAHPGAVYGSMYHPQQSGSTPTAHQLLQQQQALNSLGGQGGSYHPAQRAQQTWANGF